MKVLFIGGTGIISSACTQLAIERGIELYLLNRGQRAADIPPGVKVIHGDIREPASVEKALAGMTFDSVVDWICFTPEQAKVDIRLFAGKVGQYIFISSASAYQKPVSHYLITESTPLANPYWQYSRDKIACEELFIREYRENGFPAVNVRPSLTYGSTMIPCPMLFWANPWTLADRMLKGQPIIVHGDGTSLWVTTHNSDFAKGLVGLLGHQQSIGHAFHITSDEVLNWNQFHQAIGRALGVEPRIVHIPSDFISAHLPDVTAGLLGDKAWSVVFDNSKIKRFVPDFVATKTFQQGMSESVAWFQANPSRQIVDQEASRKADALIEAYRKGWPADKKLA